MRKKVFSYVFLCYVLLLSTLCFADSATDPLATSVRPQVAALLGSGSTVAYCIYIAEIVLGSVAYVKTKNLLLLLGVPILVLFTHAMFTYIGADVMSRRRGLYLVPKTLDAQVRILGLPLDEFVPSVFFVVFFFLLGDVVLSIVVPVLMVVFIRMMKRGQGSAWLVNGCYWYLPRIMVVQFLRKTPPSQNREYIG